MEHDVPKFIDGIDPDPDMQYFRDRGYHVSSEPSTQAPGDFLLGTVQTEVVAGGFTPMLDGLNGRGYTPYTKLVFGLIFRYCSMRGMGGKPTGKCFASVGTMAVVLEISNSEVKRAIRRLLEDKLIEDCTPAGVVNRPGASAPRHYRLTGEGKRIASYKVSLRGSDYGKGDRSLRGSDRATPGSNGTTTETSYRNKIKSAQARKDFSLRTGDNVTDEGEPEQTPPTSDQSSDGSFTSDDEQGTMVAFPRTAPEPENHPPNPQTPKVPADGEGGRGGSSREPLDAKHERAAMSYAEAGNFTEADLEAGKIKAPALRARTKKAIHDLEDNLEVTERQPTY